MIDRPKLKIAVRKRKGKQSRRCELRIEGKEKECDTGRIKA